MTENSRSEHILSLAKELLDDIELSRANAESLILKTSRLARWVGSEEIRYWLKLEMGGYNNSNEISLKYMGITGRWLDKDKQKGYWGPLAQHEARIEAEKVKLTSLRTPDSSGEWASLAVGTAINAMNQTTNELSKLSGIRTRVLAQLHGFVSEIYYVKQFDSLSESIFERYKRDIDTLIADHCGEVLEQIPSVMNRLSEGDPEAISQSLNTCRRVLDSFADNIFPPSEQFIEIGGNRLSLDASKHQNRINAFIHSHTNSNTRKKRFRQNLANLYDRVSTGVHDEVTIEEAKALFLNTYLFVGEVLHLNPTFNAKQ